MFKGSSHSILHTCERRIFSYRRLPELHSGEGLAVHHKPFLMPSTPACESVMERVTGKHGQNETVDRSERRVFEDRVPCPRVMSTRTLSLV